MKKLLTLLLAFTTAAAYAQKTTGYARLPQQDGKVAYTAVVPAEGTTAQQLYGRAVAWAAHSLPNGKVVDHTADAATGTVVVRYELKQPPQSFTDTHANLYQFVATVRAKDGRYLYQIDQITYQNENPASSKKDALGRVPIESYATAPANKRTDATLADLDKRLKALADDLTASMQATAATREF